MIRQIHTARISICATLQMERPKSVRRRSIAEPPQFIICELLLQPGAQRALSCLHAQHIPRFDAKACKRLSTEQAQKDFPRFEGKCLSCGQEVRIYASLEHAKHVEWS